DGVLLTNDVMMDKRQRRLILRKYMQENGYRPMRELMADLMVQKLMRAIYSENQLQEVLTDFWFNHFYVSILDNQARVCVPTYERDAIRPNVLGKFRNMLGATAKHPAMLLYLDNAQSTASKDVKTTMMAALKDYQDYPGQIGHYARRQLERVRQGMMDQQMGSEARGFRQNRRRRGINENYARELMELHTLGVDGGYTQKDVEDVARAFTGWTILPPGERGTKIQKRMVRGKKVGFVLQGDFLFNAESHDAESKKILGKHFPGGGGMEEGEHVLDMLAVHPSTARHISKKMAVWFISDNPPESIIEKLTETFLKSSGDLKALIITIAQSPEFWEAAFKGEKIKSPFELTVSALRITDADIQRPRQIIEWVGKMGQPLYEYSAPTGFPDRADAWINAGTLLDRINFATNLAMDNIKGVNVDLPALNNFKEPDTPDAAVKIYSNLLLPGRNTETLITNLNTSLNRIISEKQVDAVSIRGTAVDTGTNREISILGADGYTEGFVDYQHSGNQEEFLNQLTGLILGSPEFQRK
ncbi:MAG: DUF1800 domain-containing protein, partial [Calditrichia bacterium]